MRALTWQGRENVSRRGRPRPRHREPTDAVIRVTSTAICGSDLHLYAVLGPFLQPGDVLGHETMGVVEEGGSEVDHLAARRPGRDPVQHLMRSLLDVPRGLFAQCETTQVREQGRARRCSATPSCTGRCPAGRPSTCASRRPTSARSRCPTASPDERYLYLSDILPTAWQGVRVRRRARRAARSPSSASVRSGSSPRASRAHLGRRVIGVDRVPERLALAREYGIEVVDLDDVDDVAERCSS